MQRNSQRKLGLIAFQQTENDQACKDERRPGYKYTVVVTGWECLNLFCPLLYSKKQNKTLKLVTKLVNSFIFECIILILLTADGKTLFKFLAKENRSLHAAQPVNSSCRKHTESISAVKFSHIN